jgi:hypothetical protein
MEFRANQAGRRPKPSLRRKKLLIHIRRKGYKSFFQPLIAAEELENLFGEWRGKDDSY